MQSDEGTKRIEILGVDIAGNGGIGYYVEPIGNTGEAVLRRVTLNIGQATAIHNYLKRGGHHVTMEVDR